MTTKGFIRRMNGILRHNAIARFSEREKEGKINSKRIARAGVTDRVFKKKDQIGASQYNVSILLDASGSMDGYQADRLVELVHQLIPTLEHINGLSYEIVIFNMLNVVVKRFDDVDVDSKYITDEYRKILDDAKFVAAFNNDSGDFSIRESGHPRERNEEYSQADYARYGNIDSFAVWGAMRRLNERGGKNIIVTFSDGSPAGFYPADSLLKKKSESGELKSINGSKHLAQIINRDQRKRTDDYEYNFKKVIQEVKKQGIETVGIGIATDSVKAYYDHTAVGVSGTREMFTGISTLLSRIITKL